MRDAAAPKHVADAYTTKYDWQVTVRDRALRDADGWHVPEQREVAP